MIRFAFVAVFVGCGTPDIGIGDPISCPDCRPGDLFANRFLEVPSLTIGGTPVQVVYGVREERNGITEINKLAWLRSDYTVRIEAPTGIPSDSGQRIIRELAMADDGAVVALVEVEDDSGVPRTNVLMVFDPSGQQLWRRDIGPASPTVSIGPSHVFIGINDVRSITIDGRTEGGPFVAALDRKDGSFVWSRPIRISAAGGAQLHTVPDPSGAVIVGGAFESVLDLGGVTLTGTATQSGFVALLDEHGAGLWAALLDPVDDTPTDRIVASARVEHIARGPDGEVALVASWFGGPLTFQDQTYPRPQMLFGNMLALLDPDGKLAWARDVGNDVTTSILTNGQEIVAAGLFDAPLSYDGTIPEQEHDGFVATVTRDGPRWVGHARGAGFQTIDVVSYTAGGSITAVVGHEYDFEDGPKLATYGDVTIPRNGVMLGALAP